MTRMKSIKCPKSHYNHSLLMVCFCLLNIHRMCSRFLVCSNFFFVFSIEFEKFFFKYFFKKRLLWTNKEVDKNTEWCQKENNKNTKNLEYYRSRAIIDILCHPDNNTKPNNKYIEHHSSEYHIDIKLSKRGKRGWIHTANYKKIVPIANEIKSFYFTKKYIQLGFNEAQRIISFLTKIYSSLYFIFLISYSRRFFLTIFLCTPSRTTMNSFSMMQVSWTRVKKHNLSYEMFLRLHFEYFKISHQTYLH